MNPENLKCTVFFFFFCFLVLVFFAKPSLQQWFEYSASKRKKSCPVCKQTCYLNGVNRLYFQSIGDASDPIVSQNALNLGEDPGVLRKEVKILEVKVEGLTSALERNQNDLKELNEEVSDLSFFLSLIIIFVWSITEKMWGGLN